MRCAFMSCACHCRFSYLLHLLLYLSTSPSFCLSPGDMLDLLKWRAHPERINDSLSKLKEIDGSEIVKVGPWSDSQHRIAPASLAFVVLIVSDLISARVFLKFKLRGWECSETEKLIWCCSSTPAYTHIQTPLLFFHSFCRTPSTLSLVF